MDATLLFCMHCLFQLYGITSNSIHYYDRNIPQKGKLQILCRLDEILFSCWIFFFIILDTSCLFSNGRLLYVDHFIFTWNDSTSVFGNIRSFHIHDHIRCDVIFKCTFWHVLYTRNTRKIV